MLNRRDIFKGLLGLVALTAIPVTAYANAPDWSKLTKRRVILDIQKAMENAMAETTFEFNDPITRNLVVEDIRPIADKYKLNRDLYDYMIVCNETNNTDKVIDRNELYCDVYMKFPNDVKFTQLNAIHARNGTTFEEAVGSLA